MRITFKLIAGAAALAAAATSMAISAHLPPGRWTVDPKGVLVVDFKRPAWRQRHRTRSR
jgi:hypothetical protein